MPSKLVGLFKTLTWNDFTGTPNPTKPTLNAFSHPVFVLPVISPARITGTKNFHFEDNVVQRETI